MIIESLSEWNHWWRDKSVDEELRGTERVVLRELEDSMTLREIKLLIGVRRSGKSTLFYQLVSSLLDKGVRPEEILLVNFEDDVLAKKTLREVFDAYQSNVNPDTRPYLFLDEIHRCRDWVPFLRKLYDLRKVRQVFITDSSSKFIAPEYARLLTGRAITIPIFPLSFAEYLEWSGIKLRHLLEREEINRIKKALSGFLEWGGFPEVFFKTPPAKKKLLTAYFSDIIHKDIVERYNASYGKIKLLADFLASNSAAAFSPRKYSRSYGLSLESINTYLQYFKEVFLFFFVPKFDYSIRAQQLRPKKVYVCDLGFFSNVGFKFSENRGRAMENAVFVELKRRGKDVYYWKNKHECDFLIKEGLRVKEAIQVCFDPTGESREREVKGLVEALKHFRLKCGLILTDDYEACEKVGGRTVKFVPLWKWLLDYRGQIQV
ncbi:MAG: ATP-binding protein [Candidatus Hadarchaeales archaeon]